jgi:hypothetical protein
MAILKAKFIGLSSANPDAYGVPRNAGIKLNDKDVSRTEELPSTAGSRRSTGRKRSSGAQWPRAIDSGSPARGSRV